MSVSLGAIGATVLPNVGGWVGGIVVMKSYSGWYKVFSQKFVNMEGYGIPALAIALPNLGGILTAFGMRKEVAEGSWYMKTLKKPSWTPPRGAFGPVWTMLYSGMGYASYLVWRDGGGFEGAAAPLAAYGTQLALNWAWTPIFFGCHSPKWGLVDIALLSITAGATSAMFFRVNQTAGLLMIPYLGWLGIATSLNYWIFANNREEADKESKE